MKRTLWIVGVLLLMCGLLVLSGCDSVDTPTNSDPTACQHTSSDWITDKAPTCREAGSKHRECIKCKEALETASIEKLTTHTPAEAVSENYVDATCELEGSYESVVYCSVCETKLSSEIKTVEKKPHISSDWITDKAATCKEAGIKHRECIKCEEVLKITFTDKLTTHTPAEAVTENYVDASCKAEGSYDLVVYCSVCETKLSSELKTIEKKPHGTASDWITDKAATCKEAGSKHRECIKCKETLETASIERLTTHKPAEAVSENYVDATCELEGSYDSVVYCSVCKTKLYSGRQTVKKKPHTSRYW